MTSRGLHHHCGDDDGDRGLVLQHLHRCPSGYYARLGMLADCGDPWSDDFSLGLWLWISIVCAAL